MANQQVQPIIILKEGSQRTRGREAQSMNILAAKTVAQAVRTTLGPRGMDKMLVDSMGDVVITNDGATILKEMDIEHPAAKMMVEIAKTQDEEAGDGTTTAVVLAGELLTKAEELLNQEIHPTVVVSGYQMAAQKAQEILSSIAIPVSEEDEDLLKKIAITAMSSKGTQAASEKLAELSVQAVKKVAERDGDKIKVDIDNIKIEKVMGAGIADSQLIDGLIIDKERAHPGMPKLVKNAKIALIGEALEHKKTEVDAEISITSPEQLKAFLDEEEKMLKNKVEKIKQCGANVLVCQKDIDDIAKHYLAKAGIYAIKQVKKSDMEKLAKASGGKIIQTVGELRESDLGQAEIVEERKIGDKTLTFIEKCKNPRAVSLLLRGGTEHVVDETERAVHDALRVVGVTLEDRKIVAGGGAPEIEVALRLRNYAATVGGRQQLAIEAFASAMEIIPRSLAENAGLDPIDILVELRSQHERGNKTAGLDVFTGKVVDMLKEGVVEPLKVKTQAISLASEAATMILRIDDIISAKGIKPQTPPAPEPSEVPQM
ncbi:MAG: thermosome subunit alpha [Methanocellales archaeon]